MPEDRLDGDLAFGVGGRAKGDGTYFIALNAKIRRPTTWGDRITVTRDGYSLAAAT